MEAQIDTDIEKVKTAHPIEARILEGEKRALKTLSAELDKATNETMVKHLEERLNQLERRVAESLRRAEGQTGRPGRTTAQPTEATTSA